MSPLAAYLLALLALPVLGGLLTLGLVIRRLFRGPLRPGSALAEWERPEPYG